MEKIAFGSGLKELADFLLSSNEGDNYFKKEKKIEFVDLKKFKGIDFVKEYKLRGSI